jgi:ureidoacrylate peracid hydrolase
MREIGGMRFYDRLEEILDPAHCALLVVDMQNDFCSPIGHFAQHGKSVAGVQSIIQPIARLLGDARDRGIPVLHTQQTTALGLASDTPAWLYFKTRDGKSPDYTLDGSWGQQFVAELQPLADEAVIRKFRPSAFLGTELEQRLRAHGTETVVIAGCLTQGCVMATAMDASFHDFYAVVVEDCVQSTSSEQHENALRFLRSRYDVLTASEVIQTWSTCVPVAARRT